MSSRTVVAIEPSLASPMAVRLLKAPATIAGAKVPHPFDVDPDDLPSWSDAEAVRLHGQNIFARLERHPAVQNALQGLLQTPSQQIRSLYFQLDVADAERLCWETLCDDQGRFLALDRRWPIARIADSVVDRYLPIYEFAPPLRLAAFISALGIEGKPEWDALRQAVVKGRQSNCPIDLAVFVGEQPLLDAISAEIHNGLAGVRVQPMPDRSADIESALEDFAPHLLHFFCHGSTGHGVAELELATVLDWLQGAERGSVRLRIDQLAGMAAMKRVWLITLNCCEGGRATGDLHSMAHILVAEGRIPAAIGSLEPLDAADASEFSAAFYPAVFDNLSGVLANNEPGECELEWAEALRLPRTGLCELHGNEPRNHRQWALPVLYVRPESFRLKKLPGVAPEMRIYAEKVAGALRALPPDAPEQVRDQLLALLDGYPESLRPDRFGNSTAEG